MIKVMNQNKVVVKTLFFLFLFLAAVLFFECNKTVAKYEEEEEETLKYQSTIALSETEKGALSLVSKDENEAVLEFVIPRDTVNVKEGENSTYKLIVPSSCTSNLSDDFTFSEGVEEEKVELTCQLEENDTVIDKEGESFLEVSIKVLESIDGEMHFLYKEYEYSEKIETLSVLAEEEEDSTLLQFKESLIQNILMNSTYRAYQEEITSYIYDSSDPLQIPGLRIDYQAYYQYTYVIEDGFVGYARTYYENKDKEVKNVMYFTESDPVLIDDTFSYYLREYYSLNNMDQYYLAMNYISSTEKISDVVLNGKSINGVSYDVKEGKLTIEDRFREEVLSLLEDDVTTIYFSDSKQQKGVLEASIQQNSKLSPSLKQQILLNNDLINFITETNSDVTNISEYFEIDDGNTYLLIEVFKTEHYYKVAILPVSIVENDTHYSIVIDCSHAEASTLNVTVLMDVMKDALQLIKENDLYQLDGNNLSFQLAKPVEVPDSNISSASIVLEEAPVPAQAEESLDEVIEEDVVQEE